MKTFALAAVAAATFALASPALAEDCQDGEMVIKFSHVVAASGHPKGDAATMLAERVNKEMDGKACMQVFPNSQLFDDDKVMEALLLGDVQLAAPSLSKFEAYTLKYRLFDLPFLFNDLSSVDRFAASEPGKNLLNAMTDVGFIGLGYWSSGMKQFSANKPLLLPTDANGLKFRVQSSDVLAAQMEALGGTPQAMAFSEVYGALQQGVVDGQENTWSNIYGKKFFEVQDGTTETNHGIIDYLLVTSVDWLDSLDPAVRDQFLTIVDEVTAARNKESTAVNESAKQAVIDAGGVVRTLTPEQRAAWVKAMKPVWDKFADDVGADNIAAAQSANQMTN